MLTFLSGYQMKSTINYAATTTEFAISDVVTYTDNIMQVNKYDSNIKIKEYIMRLLKGYTCRFVNLLNTWF